MSYAADREAEEWSRLGLAEFLRFAVPLKAAELLRHPPEQRRRRLPYGTVAHLGAGDTIMFAGKSGKKVILVADAYAWALAYLAVSNPGGVTRFGVHWCTGGHDGCPHAARLAPEPETAARRWWEPLDELETLLATEGIDVPRTRRAPAPATTPAPLVPARRMETLPLPGDAA